MKKEGVIVSLILVHHCFASYTKRTHNTAHIVYKLYQCVAVTMQRLISAFKYAHAGWIQCDGPINGYK